MGPRHFVITHTYSKLGCSLAARKELSFGLFYRCPLMSNARGKGSVCSGGGLGLGVSCPAGPHAAVLERPWTLGRTVAVNIELEVIWEVGRVTEVEDCLH